MRLTQPLSAFLLVTLFAAGCNVLDGFEEGDTLNPDQLMNDAEIALQQDDPEKAVTYLEKALEQEPENKKVRVKLASAKLTKEDISVVDVANISQKLNSEFSGSFPAGKNDDRVCSFPTTAAHQPFDPTDISNFHKLETHKETLAEVSSLIDYVLFGADGEAAATMTQEDLRSAIVGLKEGGLSEVEIAEALMINTLSYLALAYVDIAGAATSKLDFYFVQREDGSVYVGYCAPNQETLDHLLNLVSCYLQDLGYAGRLMYARAELLGSEQAKLLAEKAGEALHRLSDELDASCTAEAV